MILFNWLVRGIKLFINKYILNTIDIIPKSQQIVFSKGGEIDESNSVSSLGKPLVCGR